MQGLAAHPLTPLLRNLDKARKEYNPDGSISIERTTREWARSLTDDKSDFHFDVVNDGPDQLAYLLFPSKHTALAAAHVDSYRKRLYPRRQCEDQFKKEVGPPTTVHLSHRVIANLEFMERLCSNKLKDKPSASPTKASASDASSSVSASTTSSVSQASKPPTSPAALRDLYKEREAGHLDESSVQSTSEISEGSDQSEATTTASTTSGKSKDSGRMSTSSAKVRQLDEVLRRHKTDSAQVQAKQSERVSQIERQLQRVHELDSKLDTIQTDFSSRLSIFEGRMEESMNSNMAKLLALVQNLVHSNSPATSPNQGTTDLSHLSPKSADNRAIQEINHLDSDGSSTLESLSSKASMTSAESPDPMQSPEHKKLKSAGKRSKKIKLKDSIRRRLDELKESSPTETLPTETQEDSDDSLDQIVDEMEDIMTYNANQHHQSPNAERQYTASPEPSVDNQAPSSPDRGSSP